MLFEQNRSSPSTASLAMLGTLRARVLKNANKAAIESIRNFEFDSKYKIHEGWKARYLSEAFMQFAGQHLNESENRIKKAIKADRENGMILHLAKSHAVYAQLLHRKGDASKARKNLNTAIDIFKDCGAEGWVGKCEKELDEL